MPRQGGSTTGIKFQNLFMCSYREGTDTVWHIVHFVPNHVQSQAVLMLASTGEAAFPAHVLSIHAFFKAAW